MSLGNVLGRRCRREQRSASCSGHIQGEAFSKGRMVASPPGTAVARCQGSKQGLHGAAGCASSGWCPCRPSGQPRTIGGRSDIEAALGLTALRGAGHDIRTCTRRSQGVRRQERNWFQASLVKNVHRTGSQNSVCTIRSVTFHRPSRRTLLRRCW